MKHLGDITRLNGSEIEPVDVITGGSPCQDLSIAGKQAGLSGDRSGLFREQMRLAREMREATGGVYPQFMIWENVPGALSNNKGADFREVLNECVKVVEEAYPYVPMPEKGGWPKAGVLYDEMGRWSIAWRIHDAQFWGVPQRRRRIALVCDFRGLRAPEVLFEQGGVRGDTAPCGATGQGTAGNPGGCPAKADAGRIAYQLVVAPRCKPNNRGGTCICERHVYDARGNGNGATTATVTGDHESRITDYTNVVVAVNAHERGNGLSLIEEAAHTLKTTTQECVLEPVAEGPFCACAPTYRVGNGQAHGTTRVTKEPAQTLNCMHEPMQIAAPREAWRYVVRRLTPLECTRLQGYPDGWVDIGEWTDTKGHARKDADTPKYKALGNSIALPFWKWLLARIYAECEAKSFDPTLGSLFDGIGGFPLSWPGRTAWSSEIDEFPLAVLRARFGEEHTGCCMGTSKHLRA